MTETSSFHKPIEGFQFALEMTPVATDFKAIELTLRLQLTPATFPISQGTVKYGLTGGTLKLTLREAQFNRFADHNNHHLFVHQFLKPEQVSWQFALPAGMDVLENELDGIPLGTITPNSQNWSAQAEFNVGAADLLITEVDGLWRHDLRPNKQAVLHRTIALFLLKTLPSPLLSLEMNQSGQKLAQDPCSTNPDVSSLLDTIETIRSASTDNFLELCETANLDPSQDFTGANLRGTTINGVDLSGANWSRVNLRGADLTDVDLSDGNLEQAKLNGADLSGAYLSNANCQQADFHRASLALANLSGANLKGANLQEANLTQTNLNDCQLEGATFN